MPDVKTVDTSSVDDLTAGESATLTADYVVTDADIAAGIVTNVVTATATDDSGNKVETAESKAVMTIEHPSEQVIDDEKPAENENTPAEETLTDVSEEAEASNDIVDIVQTGVANHSTQAIVAIVASAIIVGAIAYRKIMK